MKKTHIFIIFIFFFLCSMKITLADDNPSAKVIDPVVVEFEMHYISGIKFYQRGLYHLAIDELNKALFLDPQDPDAQEYLNKTKTALKIKNTNRAVEIRPGIIESKHLTRYIDRKSTRLNSSH